MGRTQTNLKENLKEQGYTHTREPQSGAYKRFLYTNLKTNQRVNLSEVEVCKEAKVYCKQKKENVTELIKNPTLRKKNSKNQQLIEEGYTHVKYPNKKYYNLQTSSFQGFDKDNLDNVKVYCKKTKKDVTVSVVKNVKTYNRFGHLKASVSETKMSPSSLRKEGYTHKRCNNRKLYDLNAGKYVNEKALVQVEKFKLFDDYSQTDITYIYSN